MMKQPVFEYVRNTMDLKDKSDYENAACGAALTEERMLQLEAAMIELAALMTGGDA